MTAAERLAFAQGALSAWLLEISLWRLSDQWLC